MSEVQHEPKPESEELGKNAAAMRELAHEQAPAKTEEASEHPASSEVTKEPITDADIIDRIEHAVTEIPDDQEAKGAIEVALTQAMQEGYVRWETPQGKRTAPLLSGEGKLVPGIDEDKSEAGEEILKVTANAARAFKGEKPVVATDPRVHERSAPEPDARPGQDHQVVRREAFDALIKKMADGAYDNQLDRIRPGLEERGLLHPTRIEPVLAAIQERVGNRVGSAADTMQALAESEEQQPATGAAAGAISPETQAASPSGSESRSAKALRGLAQDETALATRDALASSEPEASAPQQPAAEEKAAAADKKTVVRRRKAATQVAEAEAQLLDVADAADDDRLNKSGRSNRIVRQGVDQNGKRRLEMTGGTAPDEDAEIIARAVARERGAAASRVIDLAPDTSGAITRPAENQDSAVTILTRNNEALGDQVAQNRAMLDQARAAIHGSGEAKKPIAAEAVKPQPVTGEVESAPIGPAALYDKIQNNITTIDEFDAARDEAIKAGYIRWQTRKTSDGSVIRDLVSAPGKHGTGNQILDALDRADARLVANTSLNTIPDPPIPVSATPESGSPVSGLDQATRERLRDMKHQYNRTELLSAVNQAEAAGHIEWRQVTDSDGTKRRVRVGLDDEGRQTLDAFAEGSDRVEKASDRRNPSSHNSAHAPKPKAPEAPSTTGADSANTLVEDKGVAHAEAMIFQQYHDRIERAQANNDVIMAQKLTEYRDRAATAEATAQVAFTEATAKTVADAIARSARGELSEDLITMPAGGAANSISQRQFEQQAQSRREAIGADTEPFMVRQRGGMLRAVGNLLRRRGWDPQPRMEERFYRTPDQPNLLVLERRRARGGDLVSQRVLTSPDTPTRRLGFERPPASLRRQINLGMLADETRLSNYGPVGVLDYIGIPGLARVQAERAAMGPAIDRHIEAGTAPGQVVSPAEAEARAYAEAGALDTVQRFDREADRIRAIENTRNLTRPGIGMSPRGALNYARTRGAARIVSGSGRRITSAVAGIRSRLGF